MGPFSFPRRLRGFTIVELLVVMVIVAILVAMAAMITRGVTAGQKRSLTSTRMAAVDVALAQFVALQKRLPCPADGQLPSSNGGAGLEAPPDAANGCTSQVRGVVPWRTLGLAEQDVTDGWDRRLTYRLFPLLGATNAMDMSMCDPAGSADVLNVGCTGSATCCASCSSATAPLLAACTLPLKFLQSRPGLEVQSLSGVKVMDPTLTPPTGAAYVLISHGETGGGGYLSSGVQAASTIFDNDGTREKLNYADAEVRVAPNPPPLYYTDDGIADAPGAATHFDDVVSRPSVMTVINKAGLGARTH
jgi:prepilin-type N-terminal cleavage/methylation domain-containing protein